jgi:HD-GYP domain-containing protein (c-di-GMP phosphodiesterase class II)
MDNYLFNANPESMDQRWEAMETPRFRVPNILIPIDLDTKKQVSCFFVLENRELPESGQKNLNEITGTPFKACLAGMTVFSGPIQPPLQENYTQALIKLANSIDLCDQSGHSQTTSHWAQRLAEHLGLFEDEVMRISLAGKLHDIGKSVVSREILTKPAPLSESEWSIIKRHPGYSAALMEPSQSLDNLRPMVRWHHEHFAGGGYPDGLSGLEIPLGARILAVADAFSTMITGRAYRTPISIETALAELMRCSGTQFDPELVDHFADCVAF